MIGIPIIILILERKTEAREMKVTCTLAHSYSVTGPVLKFRLSEASGCLSTTLHA